MILSKWECCWTYSEIIPNRLIFNKGMITYCNEKRVNADVRKPLPQNNIQSVLLWLCFMPLYLHIPCQCRWTIQDQTITSFRVTNIHTVYKKIQILISVKTSVPGFKRVGNTRNGTKRKVHAKRTIYCILIYTQRQINRKKSHRKDAINQTRSYSPSHFPIIASHSSDLPCWRWVGSILGIWSVKDWKWNGCGGSE